LDLSFDLPRRAWSTSEQRRSPEAPPNPPARLTLALAALVFLVVSDAPLAAYGVLTLLFFAVISAGLERTSHPKG
jgi:hypothetical protein